MIHVERAYVQSTLDVPKGGSSRAVDMSPQLKATLRAVYAERFSMVRALDADRQADLEATQATEAADALVFPNTDGGYLEDHNFRRRIWYPLLIAAELSKHTVKDPRHTTGTLLVEQGKLPHYAQQQLGHFDVAFTMSRYVHLPANYGNHAPCLDDPTLSPTAPLTPSLTPTSADHAQNDSQESENPSVSQGVF